MPLAAIEYAARNAKRHDDDGIAASMGRFGVIDVPVLDERTQRLVSGHGRVDSWRAAFAAGDPAPDGVETDGPNGWRVPVVRGWSSTSELEADAAGVAVNQLTASGGWDLPSLGSVLDDLRTVDGGLTGTGFTVDSIDDFLASLEPPSPAPVRHKDADDVPELPTVPVTQPGDLWLAGEHRILCGSCTLPDDVARLFAGPAPDAVVTDPPYCSGGFQEAGRSQGSIGTVRVGIQPKIANDRLSTRGYVALIRAMLTAATCPIAYVFTDWRMWVHLFDCVETCGMGVRAMIVWNKGTPGMGRGWRSQHELVMHASSAVIDYDKHQSVGNVLDVPRSGNPLHPTQKPVALLSTIIATTTPVRTVYDPFAGAGSVLIACADLGRPSFHMEIDPGFVDVICRRYAEYAGEPPKRETGEPFPL